ncbi:MAG: UDP-3-O-(3-hydroxymyristoyl)glucosamine N-acyltransferase, partial [Pseudolabrys sp.]|nr:UDP-3-O-(3-hydroxymyristoyl)glucosamine N-acyltransferase [Pseudolabrys sp.]
MTEPNFFARGNGLNLAEIASLTASRLQNDAVANRRVFGIAALDRAGARDLAFIDADQDLDHLVQTRAGACIVPEKYLARAPSSLSVIIAENPYRAFVLAARALFPETLRPSSMFKGVSDAGAVIHDAARLEENVQIDPGAIVSAQAEIGSGTVIGAGAVLGPDVKVGRNCSIGAGTTLMCALLGDRVVVRPSCCIGQDGFVPANGVDGHEKVPQVGRVIIQDDVEIGAGTAINRGVMGDTVIGEGSKIDNLVQIGQNVSIGRRCIILAQSGISGSATLEDHVVLGFQVSVSDRVTIGESAHVAARSSVHTNIAVGARC